MESVPKKPDNDVDEKKEIGQAGAASQTASDFIDEQLALEADAREILPYKFDNCTHILGPLRQQVFACLTCSPPPASAAQVYTPAGVCYACSIACHGEHTLVELFNRRQFVCDCGTTRFQSTSSCTLRSDLETGIKGVASQPSAHGNHYNQNFQNRFCCCEEEYDAETQKGTMFQCLGLGTVESGGCGEDWYHPECLMGLPKDWYLTQTTNGEKIEAEEHPVPPGFPDENAFDAMICYKCVDSNPWIKAYAGTTGFLPPVHRSAESIKGVDSEPTTTQAALQAEKPKLKRKASDEGSDQRESSPSKRMREFGGNAATDDLTAASTKVQNGSTHKHNRLPPAPQGVFSLFLKEGFRDQFCHCPECYRNLLPHPQLVEEEDSYEPSISESNESPVGGGGSGRSQGTGSLLERGEAALSTMDRVKAIEGVMVYNHLKDKVKEFLKPYAESGKAVAAEDIKAYFEKLRGDDAAIREAGSRPLAGDEGED